jgi:hypothetical protein
VPDIKYHEKYVHFIFNLNFQKIVKTLKGEAKELTEW